MPTDSTIAVRARRGNASLDWSLVGRALIAEPPMAAPPAEAASALGMDALLDAFRRAMTADPEPEFGAVIFAYRRAQTIEDGVLIDVTDTAKEAGFKVPVALTASVYERYVKVPEGVVAQDEAGRLWDLYSMLRFAIGQVRGQGGLELLFKLHVRRLHHPGASRTWDGASGREGSGAR